MKQISDKKVQISACISTESAKEVTKLSETESRHFSKMIDILVAEALAARHASKNGLKTQPTVTNPLTT